MFGRTILGLKLDNVTISQAAKLILDLCLSEEQKPLLQVVTLNPEMVITARQDPRFAGIVNKAGLVVADGVGLVWGARRLGGEAVEKVPGIELTEQVLAYASQYPGKRLRVFLLGAQPRVVEAARDKVADRFPGVVICGIQHGYFRPEESVDVVERINAADTDLLLVGLGAPRQEYWIAEHSGMLRCRVSIGVGGVFDVWSGRVKRAPVIWRKMGLEWLYRLAKQPSRLPRMLALPKYVLLVYKEKLSLRGERK